MKFYIEEKDIKFFVDGWNNLNKLNISGLSNVTTLAESIYLFNQFFNSIKKEETEGTKEV